MYKPRQKFDHKGSYGHSLIIGGSYGKIGAVNLASRAVLAIGGGLVTSYIPKCGYNVLQTNLPESMCITDVHEERITNIEFDIEPIVIGLGIGMGVHDESINALELFLRKNKQPLIIDADGINMLAMKKSLLKLLPKNTILTPHPKELERLIGKWTDDYDKLEKAITFGKKHQLILVLKGANTITVYDERLYINSSGNPGMATAGSGDVLTGIITGLVSQGYDPLMASVMGVYLHGRSGDIAAQDFGFNSILASHLIDYLGEAFKDLFSRPEQQHQNQEKDDTSKDGQSEEEEMYI
jgi:hydroxyethylthiazole kinase-like uncharacterized protein yjeF